MQGRCQCGKIKFTTPTEKPLKIYACHCTECRHQSSSAHGISAIFPYFELPESVSEFVGSYTRPTSTGSHMECLFCKNCGARILHRDHKTMPAPAEKAGTPATVSVKAGCLEDLNKEMMREAFHIWTQHAVVDIPEGVEQWEQEPPN